MSGATLTTCIAIQLLSSSLRWSLSGRLKNNRPLGPLDGVPVAVKDEVHITGYKRTLGTKLDLKHGTDETSWCVKQWQDVGAIVIGKTTMHELGLGEYRIFCFRIILVLIDRCLC